MQKLELAVAIPTYNRLVNLQVCIKKFDIQLVPDYVNLSLVISNSASTDGTSDYLSKLARARENMYIFNEILDWENGNYGGILEALPNKIDWVWFMGDDDEFSSSMSIHKICDLISKNQHKKDFAFVHACDELRSKKTGMIYRDTTINLCKRFGYLEMLGWFTSLIVRKSEFVVSLTEIHQQTTVMRGKALSKTPYSAFFHSSYFLQNLYEKVGIFLDEPVVREQSKVDKIQTEHRWQNENMGERYLFVVDDFERLISLGLPLTNLPSEFFKYHRYHLWDRFIIFQISAAIEIAQKRDPKLVTIYKPKFLQNWQRIETMATMLNKSEIQKWLIIVTRNAQAQCDLLFSNPDDKNILGLLAETRKYLTLGCYDYSLDYAENKIFRSNP